MSESLESKGRSEKALEKQADQYMAVSTSTFTAVIVGFLVVPLTEMVKAIIGLSESAYSFNFMSVAEGRYSHPSEVYFSYPYIL
jgi:hypothetical protein